MPPSHIFIPFMSTLQCNVMVPSHQSISLTPWYAGILLWYASVSHIRHSIRVHRHTKGTFWWPTVLTLWYHLISISRLCYNATLVCFSLTNTSNYSVTLWHPQIIPSWLRNVPRYLTLVWFILAYTPHPSNLSAHHPA